MAKRPAAPGDKPAEPAAVSAVPPHGGIVAEAWSYQAGPLPPAAELAEYDKVIPGAAERILVVFERQVDHRQSLEKAVVQSELLRAQRGQWFAFLLAVLVFLTGGYVITAGHDTAGVALATTTLAGLVAAFLWGSESRRAERADKTQRDEPTPLTGRPAGRRGSGHAPCRTGRRVRTRPSARPCRLAQQLAGHAVRCVRLRRCGRASRGGGTSHPAVVVAGANRTTAGRYNRC